MKLVTFQSFEAVKDLFKKGYLECDKTKIDLEKVGLVYEWINEKMNKKVDNPYSAEFPLWCWVKCYNNICPPKRKGKKVNGFDVKITFNKNKEDVFITDFRRYSFLLNNQYIPETLKEKEIFDHELMKSNISKEDLMVYIRRDKYKEYRKDEVFTRICRKIRETFDRCITDNSDILQGCVWRINIEDIEKIEILKDDGYVYGSLNYIRSDGKRFDWIEDYYKRL